MAEILMTNTIKDDESMLPGIYPSEREHQLSSIFIEADTPLVNHFPFQILSSTCNSAGKPISIISLICRDDMELEVLVHCP